MVSPSSERNGFPLISVVVPVYNVERCVERSLRSVTSQTYRNIEIVAVNDGSTDGSLAVVKACAAADSRIKVVDTPNRGLLRAWGEGVSQAAGDYVCFLDSDDTLEPGIVEALYRRMREGNYDLVCCDFRRVKEGSYSSPVHRKSLRDLSGYEYLEQVLSYRVAVTAWGKLYKKELFADLEYPPGLWKGQDGVMNLQIGFKRPRVGFIPDIGYNYIQRAGSVNHKNFDLAYLAKFCGEAERLLNGRPELKGRAEFYALLCQHRWWSVYIKKSSHSWAGKAPYARRFYQRTTLYRQALKGLFPVVDRWAVRLYPYRGLFPLVKGLGTLERWSVSLRRRLKAGAASR